MNARNDESGNRGLTRRRAIRFVILMGLISLFADMTYEGARSISGPYLAVLGASGFLVGLVSGLGEFMGYALRLASGYLSDRTRYYWTMTFIGYFINLLAVPLLAFTHHWPAAAMLLVAERLGRAIRTPARDTMLSYASHVTGRGWGFGLHEAMDQAGAIIGPLAMAGILAHQEGYSLGFALLIIPALIAIGLLVFSRNQYPHPEDLEIKMEAIEAKGFKKPYWIFVAAGCCIAAGFVDFPLIAYHFEREKIAPAVWIPLLYSFAMGVDGIASLILGKWLDSKGAIALIFSSICSSLLAPFVFFGNFSAAFIGIALWGIGMGAQESIMRAIVAHLAGTKSRATAFGLFHFWFGIFWLSGSAFMGFLYDFSLTALVIFSVLFQLASLPLIWTIRKQINFS